jgi:hypothetical protein
MLIGPVMDKEGTKVIGLIELVNKRQSNKAKIRSDLGLSNKGEEAVGFSENDEKLLKLLCCHAANFVHQVASE